jgi:hypothetical protein
MAHERIGEEQRVPRVFGGGRFGEPLLRSPIEEMRNGARASRIADRVNGLDSQGRDRAMCVGRGRIENDYRLDDPFTREVLDGGADANVGALGKNDASDATGRA